MSDAPRSIRIKARVIDTGGRNQRVALIRPAPQYDWGNVEYVRADELATARAQLSAQAETIRRMEGAAACLTNCVQILDAVKLDWRADWTQWDQSVRDSISTCLAALQPKENEDG